MTTSHRSDPVDYAKKLAAMRAYAKTPAGKASRKASHVRYVIKRRELTSPPSDGFQINPQALITALAQWR